MGHGYLITAGTPSLNLMEISKHLRIYPNPCSSGCRIEITNIEPGLLRLTLYKSAGYPLKQVEQIAAGNTTTIDLDLASLPEGMYILTILNDQKIWKECLIKISSL